eukprot:9319865-Pyramimonas_sp.AAC.1
MVSTASPAALPSFQKSDRLEIRRECAGHPYFQLDPEAEVFVPGRGGRLQKGLCEEQFDDGAVTAARPCSSPWCCRFPFWGRSLVSAEGAPRPTCLRCTCGSLAFSSVPIVATCFVKYPARKSQKLE